nr:YheC/YheD family protein [Neobacillus sp. Marseille-Q6967]
MKTIEPDKRFPLVGILTSRKKTGEIAGNGSLFMEIQKKLISLDGISFVFTLDGIKGETIEGFIYSLEKNSWELAEVPFPDIIYNRIPFRSHEQDEKYSDFLSLLKKKNIPFFNPGFIDKYELYCLLKDNKVLNSFLPDTILANQQQKLNSFLKKHASIYLKPACSSKGKGIFKLAITEKQKVHLEGLIKKQTYKSFNQFWDEWNPHLCLKQYVAQEEIKSSLINGKRFDFRILAHAVNDLYVVTGVGIRQSQHQDLTTHIPTGGRLVPYQLIQTEEHDRFIQKIVQEIGRTLTRNIGFFGEFSIDAAINQAGKYYIFEVNSKPMSFDEPEIEKRKIDQLCKLFLQLSS